MLESLNKLVKAKQMRAISAFAAVLVLMMGVVIALIAQGGSKKPSKKAEDMTGIINESFTEANTESAMLSQQTELDALKANMAQLNQAIASLKAEQEKAAKTVQQETVMPTPPVVADSSLVVQNPELWHPAPANPVNDPVMQMPGFKKPVTVPRIHRVSFRHHEPQKKHDTNWLNPAHYVPSNTSVQAIVLGGADSDASVNGQSKNNGTMLFKFLENGTLPNGQRSRLKGCRVSANTYGDISSERAIATLYRLSCAHPGEPIIDKKVSGWVFFNGKVGIKGQPLMRDNKVMQWAGFSGALAGVAQAAQYAQTVQQFGAFGSNSAVPSNNIAPYAGYGGASKAADTLSQYYVKRAEQYHPVIQVGAGNLVTIVFEDGFYLEPDEDMQRIARERTHMNPAYQARPGTLPYVHPSRRSESTEMNFNIPPELLNNIDRVNANSRYQGAHP